ncbi:MAG: hypothetical protein ACK5IQ_11625 [Bacteroidales bacterium]
MSTTFVKYTITFILFILLQVFILDGVMLWGMFNPILYMTPIILMPRKTHTIILMFMALILGGIVDIFNDTIAINAAATVFLAFIRNSVYGLVDSDINNNTDNRLASPTGLPLSKYIIFLCVLVFFHHLALYLLDAFSTENFLYILLISLLNTVITVVILMIFKRWL